MPRIILTILLLFSMQYAIHAQTELKFIQLDSLFAYTEKHSAAIKTGEQQAILAKWQKVAALANTINFRNQFSFVLTDNTQLPVNFLPAEAFGGTPGSFKEVQFGQQYIDNATLAPQIDIINPASWEKVKTANINQELTLVNNLITKKSLYESIAAAYYNMVSLQQHIKLTEENLLKADTLLSIVKNKYVQGLVRQQDVNDAFANKLTLEDKLKQVKFSLEQQELALKILCDFPDNAQIIIYNELKEDDNFSPELIANSQLQFKASSLQLNIAKSDLKYNRLTQLPTVSLFLNYGWQQNSNNQFFDSQSKWIYSNYIGARFVFNIPDVNKIFLSQNAALNYRIALHNFEHSKIQNNIANRQLQLDYQKAYSQFITFKQIYELKNQNYNLAFNQYEQTILPFDKLLVAFNEMLNSRINYVSATANLHYQKTKIDLNNSMK